MDTIAGDPFEKNALDYFDIISWVDCKIQNRPFEDVVREKFTKKESVQLLQIKKK